ncbi:hypothetical protein LCGC14_0664180 [marine sediment metagenome]|uniref:Uncharacterized protein n=1 Tax=marine sediment metagenome TaxID=412755 RepID=A0A0F9U114_9ZZZZ
MGVNKNNRSHHAFNAGKLDPLLSKRKGTKYPLAPDKLLTIRKVTTEKDSVLVATDKGVFRFKDGKGELIS